MSYEQIQNIHLHPDMFTIDNQLATPTMKIKRLAVREDFYFELDMSHLLKLELCCLCLLMNILPHIYNEKLNIID